jgi:hypothetical protein
VDATMSCAHEVPGRVQTRERSREACKTNGIDAYGEVVWSWHPLLMLSPRGGFGAQPGTRSHSIREGDGGKKELVTGESAK